MPVNSSTLLLDSFLRAQIRRSQPISLQDMKIARRSTPARPLPESVFCPEPGTWANYWKPEPDIDAVVDCTSFDDTLCKFDVQYFICKDGKGQTRSFQ